MSISRKALFALALPAALAIGSGAWIYGGGGNRAASVRYVTAPVSVGAIRKLVATSGPVRALVTVSVGSQLSGKVVEVHADFNAEVKKGDLLAVIDTGTFATKVAQAEADLAAATAELANRHASLTRAKAVLRQAERSGKRQRVLSRKGFATRAALDEAIRDIDVARADIAVAEAQIASASAMIQQRQAQLAAARIDLDRTRIVSPLAGTVISRTVDVGQTVAASLQAPELFQIAKDLRRIRIEAQVNEADVGAIAKGNKATFTVDAYPERIFTGIVRQVRLAATEINNVVTYTVIVEASNDDRRLFPGMTANVGIEIASREGTLRISSDALRFKPRGMGAAAPAHTISKGGRRGRLLARLKEELQLSDEQVAAVRAKLRAGRLDGASRDGARPGGIRGPGADPGTARRERRMKVLETALRPLLNDKQRQLFDAYKRGRRNVRTATVWVLGGSGRPVGRRVRLGISDERYTEVVGGQISKGDPVITRARRAKR